MHEKILLKINVYEPPKNYRIEEGYLSKECVTYILIFQTNQQKLTKKTNKN